MKIIIKKKTFKRSQKKLIPVKLRIQAKIRANNKKFKRI
jgi:hypothetical protein